MSTSDLRSTPRAPRSASRHQTRRARAVARAAVLAVGGAVLTSCASAVAVPPPEPGPQAAKLCRSLHGKLPDHLAGKERRPTEPDSPLVAAWGSPPIALRCGVGRPASLRPTSRLVTVNGVDWLPEPADAPTRFTTVGRKTRVQVIVPDAEFPAAGALVGLAGPVTSAIPAGEPGDIS